MKTQTTERLSTLSDNIIIPRIFMFVSCFFEVSIKVNYSATRTILDDKFLCSNFYKNVDCSTFFCYNISVFLYLFVKV